MAVAVVEKTVEAPYTEAVGAVEKVAMVVRRKMSPTTALRTRTANLYHYRAT